MTIEERVQALEALIQEALEVGRSHGVRHLIDGSDPVLGQVQIGIVAPSHSAPEGTIFWDTVADTLYMNANGASTWQLIGGGAGAGSHTILSATHTDSAAADVPTAGDVLKRGATLWAADRVAHAELTGVGAADHHAALSAGTAISVLGYQVSHAADASALPSAHHTRYTDAEARLAMPMLWHLSFGNHRQDFFA